MSLSLSPSESCVSYSDLSCESCGKDQFDHRHTSHSIILSFLHHILIALLFCATYLKVKTRVKKGQGRRMGKVNLYIFFNYKNTELISSVLASVGSFTSVFGSNTIISTKTCKLPKNALPQIVQI